MAIPTRLLIGNGDGSFSVRSTEFGLVDRRNGRGVVCFEYDPDGDVDILVANSDSPPSLFRNDLEGPNRSVTVRLRGPVGSNTEGIGAAARSGEMDGPTRQSVQNSLGP